ncbi:hypothetical protein [Kitasatospora sp. NPDC097643]|uniref:hypothetical protein n=1 Tax=Kitasatospora sp. NPDC097643 TaxID=3157230 RepID=UPI00331AFF28
MTSTASHSATPPHGRPGPGSHGGVPEAGALRAVDGGLTAEAAGAPAAGAPAAGNGPEGTLTVGAGPWSVRVLASGRRRAALEVYQHGELADVLVAARLTPQLLRGARRSPAAGRASHVLAWGRLAADGSAPSVAFTTGRPAWLPRFGRAAVAGRTAVAAEVVPVAGQFWLAWAEGPFAAVLVRHPGGDMTERQPLERVRAQRAQRAQRARRIGRAA